MLTRARNWCDVKAHLQIFNSFLFWMISWWKDGWEESGFPCFSHLFLLFLFLWFLYAGNDSCCSRPQRSNSTKYQLPKNDQSRIWCSLNKYLVAKRNEKYQKRCKIPNDQPESCWVSADQVMHQYQLQDTGYTNNSKQGQYKKREKRTKKSTWYLMVFVEVDGVVFLHLPRLLDLHPALLCRLLQHVQLLLDLF